MNAVGRSRALLSLLCRSRGLLEQKCVFRAAWSSALHPQSHHAAALRCHVDTRRCYSDFGGENRLVEGTSQELVVEMDHKDDQNSSPGHGYSERFNLDVLVSLLRQENAVDMCVIKVPEHIKYTEYFIVVSGISPRHLRAMALYAIKVYKFLRKDGDPNVKIEGKDAEDWMCIDFGNMVVHFMLPETREIYELEKLWILRSYDEQLKSIPPEVLPEDFMYDMDITK
ncbi:mitochondrial assembly of ribosomal large subunit protein 1 [Oryzias melastigma]|uniref:Mitochondrial assembly of ribosomal large subunit protein 1 n=1 Tax=Oryzias melastigma TaxID=30732 RepID=A0A3B3DWV7_ORYME|nr:mitochondrial assembly of ribosomal large subunit protein 1 [Oryzias melastigma]